MKPYSRMKRKQLAALLQQRGFVKPWMLTYLKAREMVVFLEYSDAQPEGECVELPERDVKLLQQRRKNHAAKSKLARKERSAQYGTTNLTIREILTDFVNSTPGLKFVECRTFSEPFVSPTGNSRGATDARVFKDAKGNEYFLTRSECKFINSDLNVRMPSKVFQHNKKASSAAKAQGMHTLDNLW